MPLVLPGAGDGPLLDIYQIEIRGLIMGKDTPFKISNLDGLGAPDVRDFDRLRPNDHGAYVGMRDLLGVRKLAVELTIVNPGSDDGVIGLMDSLSSAWQVSKGGIQPLRIRLPGWNTRRLQGRPRKIAFDVKQMIYGVVKGQLEYIAMDPRLYDDVISNHQGGMPVFGGTGFPIGFDMGFGGFGDAVITVNNLGDFPTRPVVIVTGPVTNPRLENVNTGEALQFFTSLSESDALTIDFDARTVTLNGVSRYGTIAPGSVWWELAPGVTDVRFTGSNRNTIATAAIYWRSAWI